jgi:hypothetical protein
MDGTQQCSQGDPASADERVRRALDRARVLGLRRDLTGFRLRFFDLDELEKRISEAEGQTRDDGLISP